MDFSAIVRSALKSIENSIMKIINNIIKIRLEHSVKITLNCMGILVSRQEGHSRFEPVNTIPLEVLRMFADK